MQPQTSKSTKTAAEHLAEIWPDLERAGIVRPGMRPSVPGAEPKAVLDRCKFTQSGQAEYGEIWRSHPTLPVDISDLGNVRRSDGKDISIWLTNKYKTIRVAGKNYYVHRLALEVWIGPRPSGAVARHINGRHTDNSRTNLEWSTPRQNMADRVRDGKRICGPPMSEYGRLRLKEMLLADVPQDEIARRLEISTRAVRYWRKKIGIPSRIERRALQCAGVN